MAVRQFAAGPSEKARGRVPGRVSLGALMIGLRGGPAAVKAMATVLTALIVTIAVRALIRI